MEDILKIAVCAMAGLFALLHGIAAISQLPKSLKSGSAGNLLPHLLMLAGGLTAAAAVAACLLGSSFDWLLMLLGGSAVCGAALWNGRRAAAQQGDQALFHLAHHISRAAVMLILVVNFVRV